MAERRRLPGNLWGGLVLLAVLGALGAGAPLVATSHPWIARDGEGLRFPALRALVRPTVPAPPGVRTLLPAPIRHDPNHIDLRAQLRPPSRRHWLGTDDLGRDLAARVVHGARVSLAVGLLAALCSVLIGVPVGAWAGYRGGPIDFVLSRAVEAGLAIPALLLALAILATASGWLAALPEVARMALVLGVTGWMPAARYVRAEILELRESDMVAAARGLGAGDVWIVTRHVLPSAVSPVLVTAAFAVGGAIGLEAALSFLGLGVRPPHATWGTLLADSREQITRAWWLAVFPGLALFSAILACNFVAEGVRDLLDPRTVRR